MRKTSMTAFWVFVHITAWIGILTPAVFAFKSQYHGSITREVLQEATMSRTIDGHVLRFQRSAIQQIVLSDIDQDEGALRCSVFMEPGGAFADSANHFDSEDFNTASKRARDRFNDAVKALTKPSPDGRTARRNLGWVLHGAQDYYSHSNWIDLNPGTTDNRLAVSLFSAVDLSTPTCQAPPNTGTYVAGLTGLTSGYYFSCGGKDDTRLPPGKCYHGFSGPPYEDHEGTNKDDPSRTGFVDARTAAKNSTRDIINRVLDSPGIAGNLNRTAALMGYRSNTFAIDTRGCPVAC